MHIVTDNTSEIETQAKKSRRNTKIKRYAFTALVAASLAVHAYDAIQKKNQND